jgi:predicted membrane protein
MTRPVSGLLSCIRVTFSGGFMDLFSLQYILFVLILAVVYYTVGKKKQWIVLLAASLLYYSVLSLGGILFLLVNAISTYLGAQLLFSLETSFAAKKKDPSLDRGARKALKTSVQKKKRVILVDMLPLCRTPKYKSPMEGDILCPEKAG